MIQPIKTELEFTDLIQLLLSKDVYGIDTEFVSEGTYYPELALVQLAWRAEESSSGESEVAIIDPQAVSPDTLKLLFEGPGLAITHACSQDLMIFAQVCGTVPKKIVDLQIAAGFLNMNFPGLATLVRKVLDKEMLKSSRLTDWRLRPLTEAQLEYAAADVADIIELYDIMSAQLKKNGRIGWLQQECERIRKYNQAIMNPENAWKKLKNIKKLDGQDLAVAKEVAKWREQKAQDLNINPKRLLSELGLLAISTRAPKSAADLKNLRGLDSSFVRGPNTDEIILAVKRGLRSTGDSDVKNKSSPNLNSSANRGAIQLAMAWLSVYSAEIGIDMQLLATRADLEDFFSEKPTGRLVSGWQADLLSECLLAIASGKAALALDKKGKILLERRK